MSTSVRMASASSSVPFVFTMHSRPARLTCAMNSSALGWRNGSPLPEKWKRQVPIRTRSSMMARVRSVSASMRWRSVTSSRAGIGPPRPRAWRTSKKFGMRRAGE